MSLHSVTRILPYLLSLICLIAILGGSSEYYGQEGGDEKNGGKKDSANAPGKNKWGSVPLFKFRGDSARVTQHGGAGTPDKVGAALDWLVRHQYGDGSWSSDEYRELCRNQTVPCTSRNKLFGEVLGYKDYDVGVTGLALLAFLAQGDTHRDAAKSKYKQAIKRATDWLLTMQKRTKNRKTNGFISGEISVEAIYNHAIATQALAELLVGSGDTELLAKPVKRAASYLIRARNDGYAWQFGFQNGKNDSSVTAWCVAALKAAEECARAGYIDLPEEKLRDCYAGAAAWYAKVTSDVGVTGLLSASDSGAYLGKNGDPYPFSKDPPTMTAAMQYVRLLANTPEEGLQEKTMKRILGKPPKWVEPGGKRMSSINFYYWYHGSLAVFLTGNKKHWNKWNRPMKRILTSKQRKGGCESGSWDPVGEWGRAGGRVYSTAINALTLSTYTRYDPTVLVPQEEPAEEGD